MQSPPFEFDPVRLAAWSTIAAVTVAFLVLGEALLVPLAIAVFIWVLLGAIKSLLIRAAPEELHVPGWLANVLAILIVAVATYFSMALITSQSDELVAAIPVYQANFAALFAGLKDWLNIEELPTTESLLSQLDLAAILSWIGN